MCNVSVQWGNNMLWIILIFNKQHNISFNFIAFFHNNDQLSKRLEWGGFQMISYNIIQTVLVSYSHPTRNYGKQIPSFRYGNFTCPNIFTIPWMTLGMGFLCCIDWGSRMALRLPDRQCPVYVTSHAVSGKTVTNATIIHLNVVCLQNYSKSSLAGYYTRTTQLSANRCIEHAYLSRL